MITVVEKVRFYETDMMGIAHHSNHIRWFECGRCEYLAAAGIDLFALLDRGISYPIKSVSCEYISPINYADTIDIETRLVKLSRAQMVFQNPFASLNPRMIVGDIIGRVLRVQLLS